MATDLTNLQWRRIRPLIPGSEMERTGARWGDLPRRYPPSQTCHQRFQKWVREGVLDEVLTALGEELREYWRGIRSGQPPTQSW